MIHRRSFLASTGVIAFMPGCVAVATSTEGRLQLSGAMAQGSLVVGNAGAGARATVGGVPVHVAANGRLAFGFEYDQSKPTTVVANFADGTTETREVTPTARNYEIQRINGLPPEEAHPSSPDIVARIQREHALVAEARKTDSDMEFFADPLDWPARGIISGLFGSQRILNGTPSAPHFGVDIAGGEGADIHAPASGRVLVADQFFLEGGYTLIDHGHGVFTGYMHQSKQLVNPGDAVMRGQLIGNIGHTGRATGPHLHWQMNWFNVRLDPSLSTRTPAPEKT
jgi:murein DD-endopeptidase MepM/ murein hydrolase activator NlpD